MVSDDAAYSRVHAACNVLVGLARRLVSLPPGALASCLGLVLMLSGTTASAQQVPNRPTTVQLPTFSFFAVSTTVSVPDGGGASLGGVSRAADAAAKFGYPWANRALSSQRQVSGSFVRAYVHDFEALERELAGANARAGQAPVAAARGIASEPAAPQDLLARQLAADAQDSVQMSVAEIKAQRRAAQAAIWEEVQTLLSRGQAALDQGQPALAKIYFQSALRKASAEQREQIRELLDAAQRTSPAK